MPLFTLRPYDYRIFCPRCAKLHTTFCFAVFFHLPKPSHSHYTDWSHRHKTASATMKPHPLVLLFSALASKHVLRYRRQHRDEKRCSRPYSFRPNTLQNKRSEKNLGLPNTWKNPPSINQPGVGFPFNHAFHALLFMIYGFANAQYCRPGSAIRCDVPTMRQKYPHTASASKLPTRERNTRDARQRSAYTQYAEIAQPSPSPCHSTSRSKLENCSSGEHCLA